LRFHLKHYPRKKRVGCACVGLVGAAHPARVIGGFPADPTMRAHIVDGKVVERKSVRDMVDSLKQIGVIEPTKKAKKLFLE